MLTFTKASGATLGTYFDEHLLPSATKANYYLDSNSPGRWDGKLMSKFDLSHEPVEKHDFISIAKNEDPITGNRITPRNSEARRAAWDVCLSAVKSASIALLKDPEIKKIHEECSRLTMLELEKSILAQNNDQYGRGYDETGHGLWASFTHLESRASLVPFKGREAYIPDVQLHTHNILMGITYSNSRNSFFALENFNSKSLASYYEAYYHSLMAYKLREKGYVIRRTAKRYEIEGISRQVIEKFSNRTAHIEKVAKDKNITDQKAKSELGAKTRVSKSKAEDLTAKELHEHWISRLTPEELNDLETLKEQTDTQQETLSVKEVVDRAIEHWEERYSAFPIQRVMATALSLSYGQYIPSDIEKEIRSRPNILTKDIDTIESMATKEMVRVENRLNELALSAKSQVVPDKPKDFNHFNLNQQQEKVYREVLQSPNALHLIKGGAGTGKSRLLSAVNETVNELNKSLFAITPTSQQAEMLRQDGLQADTIAALLTNPTLAENFKDGYLIVDEAGQVGVKDMTKILELAKAQKAKAILSGDSNQHHSVAYGDAFRMLQERAKIPVSTLQNIVRQKPDNYRKAIAELSAGRTLEGYQKLDKMHAIKEIEDHDERMENIASDYIKSREQNRSALVVSPTNHEGSLINSVIRQKLREKGKLKGQDKTFNTLRSLSLTEAQRKDPFVYEESMVLKFVKDQKNGIKGGDHFEVLPRQKNVPLQMKHIKTGAIKTVPLKAVEHYQVFTPTKTDVAVGDSIRLTSNAYIGKSRLFNGTVHQIKEITPNGLKLENGKILPNDFTHWKHGYTETSHSSQGKTVMDVYISMSDLSFSAASKEQFYVSASRGSHSITCYTSSKDDLKRTIKRSSKRITAYEIAQGQEQKLLSQKQRNHHRSLNEKIREHSRHVQKDRTSAPTVSQSRRYERKR